MIKCSQFWIEKWSSIDGEHFRIMENIFDRYASEGKQNLIKQVNHGEFDLTDLKKIKMAIEDFLTDPFLNIQASAKETKQEGEL